MYAGTVRASREDLRVAGRVAHTEREPADVARICRRGGADEQATRESQGSENRYEPS
jgi:hypothetical protein